MHFLHTIKHECKESLEFSVCSHPGGEGLPTFQPIGGGGGTHLAAYGERVGTPPPSQGRSLAVQGRYPPSRVRTPPRSKVGTPPPPCQHSDYLRVVCLLRSRRRTFLLITKLKIDYEYDHREQFPNNSGIS